MRFEESGQWRQAVKRAEEFDVNPDLVERKLTRNGVARHYTVYSPRSERTHPVLVEVSTLGEASVLCLCEAGRRDIACWHAAACLIASGHLRPAPTRESRLRGRRSLALLNGNDEEYDSLTAQLKVPHRGRAGRPAHLRLDTATRESCNPQKRGYHHAGA